MAINILIKSRNTKRITQDVNIPEFSRKSCFSSKEESNKYSNHNTVPDSVKDWDSVSIAVENKQV